MIVLCPDSISSANPFSRPSSLERFWKSGLTFLVRCLVTKIISGIVNTKITHNFAEILSIIMAEPVTVTVQGEPVEVGDDGSFTV